MQSKNRTKRELQVDEVQWNWNWGIFTLIVHIPRPSSWSSPRFLARITCWYKEQQAVFSLPFVRSTDYVAFLSFALPPFQLRTNEPWQYRLQFVEFGHRWKPQVAVAACSADMLWNNHVSGKHSQMTHSSLQRNWPRCVHVLCQTSYSLKNSIFSWKYLQGTQPTSKTWSPKAHRTHPFGKRFHPYLSLKQQP